MQKLSVFIILFSSALLFASLVIDEKPDFVIDKMTPVWEVLERLGEPLPNHKIDESVAGASAERGKDLVLKGKTKKPKGGKTKIQSKHFVCTSCHNVQKEDLDLSVSDPQKRLEYASKNGLPFLQGTTLYGAVNRISFYNDDYEKKYGKLVEPTRNNLREAIQLCAIECSQGRKMKDWEVESVLMYLWTLELKLKDLNLEKDDYELIQSAISEYKGEKDQETINFIQSFYQKGAPAHFITPPENRKDGYNLQGNPDNGKLIYDLSCKHCHEGKRYSFFILDDSKSTFKYLKNHFPKYSHSSIYQVARYGTSPLPGKKAYMPQYTAEKMSDQQMEDLRAYIEMMAK
jgi:mono/diheme cytochrome c family protein